MRKLNEVLPNSLNVAVVAAAILVLVGVALTLGVQQLLSDPVVADDTDGGESTVRISALKSADGAVRVALQQQDVAGAWGERQHPNLNTVRADAPAGVWLNSSPLEVSAAVDDDGPLFCVIAHGSQTDFFWLMLRGYVWQASLDLGADVRFVTSLDGAVQAAAIKQCSADDAAVIAATLADPQAVTEALLAAKQAGARIVTFNSGAQYAAAAGSEFHVALDDQAAGERAAIGFNQREVTGTVACVIHEEENVGLEQRCDAFEQTYIGGSMIRMRLSESADAETVTDEIAARLTSTEAPPIHALLTLNEDTLLRGFRAVVRTADQLDWDVQIVGIGAHIELTREPLDLRIRHVPFAINSLAEAQGYLITSAMQMAYKFHAPPSAIVQPMIFEGSPFIYDFNSFRSSPQEVASIIRRIQELFTAPDLD